MERDIKPTYDELESYVENLQKQLADAQATIAALQARVKECEAAMEKQVAILEEINKLDAERAAFVVDLKSQLTQRTAELERVTGELQKAERCISEWVDRHSTYFSKLEIDFAKLHALIATLPKVEGEIAVKETEIDLAAMWGITVNGLFGEHSPLFDTKEEADAYAALLQHRQGMEG